MKRTILTAMVLAAAMPFAVAGEKKTLGERTIETLDKVGDKTMEAGKVLATETKEVVEKAKAAVNSDKDAHSVDVKLIEHRIEMPQELSSGMTAFVVKNMGKERHNFEIKGEGLEKKFLLNLAPEDSKVLHVDLKPGSYQAMCPMEDHAGKSMKIVVTVK